MTSYKLRLVTEEDTSNILNIYKPYIDNTVITFEFESPSVDEFKNRIKSISAEYPYIVCTCDDIIVGYAYAGRHKERAAYQWNAELSIYIDESYQHAGIGKKMYQAIIEILILQNIKNVYACITSPNENSESFHKHLGFEKLGLFHKTGFKCGIWHDVAWYEKAINTHELSPKPFQSIKTLDGSIISDILKKYS